MNQGYVSVTGVVPYIRHSQPHNTLGWSKYGRPLMNHPQRRNSSHKNSLHNPNQAFPRVKSWGYPGCFGVSLFLTYPPPRHGRVRNGWKHSVKGSISYKVKKLRTPTFNQTLQEIWVCRAYAIHGHSRTENQKHLTALKAPVIYQEARKAGQEDSQSPNKNTEAGTNSYFFHGVAQYPSPKNCNLSLSITFKPCFTQFWLHWRPFLRNRPISCGNLCLRTPSPERSTGISSYLFKGGGGYFMAWSGKPMCK